VDSTIFEMQKSYNNQLSFQHVILIKKVIVMAIIVLLPVFQKSRDIERADARVRAGIINYQ
jgi:hypothetical protein